VNNEKILIYLERAEYHRAAETRIWSVMTQELRGASRTFTEKISNQATNIANIR